MPGPGSGTLSGSVHVVTSQDLVSRGPLADALKVRAPDASAHTVEVTTDAGGVFSLEGVETDPLVWVGVGTFDGSNSGLYMDTLQAVDDTAGTAVDLAVVQRTVMEQIAQTFVSAPTLNPMQGHAIVKLLDSGGNPISDLAVTYPRANGVSVGYDAGDTYSEQTGATSGRGTVVLLNLPASPYPGSIVGIVAENTTERFDLSIRVATGSVTLATARAAP
jgi:hypothetical protein